MRVHLLFAVLFMVIGFVIGGYTYSKVFDPVTFLHRSQTLASKAYAFGCLKGSEEVATQQLSDSQIEWCEVESERFLNELQHL